MQTFSLCATTAAKLSLCLIKQHATTSYERGDAKFNAFFNLGTRPEMSASHTGHLTRRPEAYDIHWTGSCVGLKTNLYDLENKKNK